jgi:hypothetical protein
MNKIRVTAVILLYSIHLTHCIEIIQEEPSHSLGSLPIDFESTLNSKMLSVEKLMLGMKLG